MQGFEPALVEAFFSELFVETFDVAVFYRISGFNEKMPNSLPIQRTSISA